MAREKKTDKKTSSSKPKNESSSSKSASQKSAPKQPGLLAQTASTAAGAAVGSVVGHAVGNAVTGSGKKEESSKHPCEAEMRAWIDCGKREAQLKSCNDFLEALKKCRAKNGIDKNQ